MEKQPRRSQARDARGIVQSFESEKHSQAGVFSAAGFALATRKLNFCLLAPATFSVDFYPMPMIKRPTVSVLLTSYNRQKYLAASIESVLAQHLDTFELIIVDDASTDGSLAIARDYGARDLRIRVLVNPRNLGDYLNRNRAAELATGEFIKYHDSDDLMYPHCLSLMVSLMRSEPSAGLGLSLQRRFTGGPVPMLLSPRQCYQREFLGSGLFSGGPSNALFRRDVLEALGGFEDHGNASDDYFWLRACARVNVLALPADLFWSRMHPGRASNTGKALEDYTSVIGAQWRALRDPTCPLMADERDLALRTVAHRLVVEVWRDLIAGRVHLARLRIARSGMSAADFLRYTRRPKPSAFAGTPLTPEGEFVTPNWNAFARSEERVGEDRVGEDR
jgi:hypothetical protein